MPYAGKTLLPREIAELCAPYWGGAGLVKAVATCLGESHGSIGAWHDNLDDSGKIKSRDCGIFQVNIPARAVGTADEDNLRTESMDPMIWRPVAEGNVAEAHNLYNQPWTRNDKPAKREWQPWVAYTTGWATFPEWWVWARPTLDHWAATGRYVQQAIVGVANYHLLIAKDRNPEQAVFQASQFQKTFKVKGELGYDSDRGVVKWMSHPSKPAEPPADGIGPRPRPNDGH